MSFYRAFIYYLGFVFFLLSVQSKAQQTDVVLPSGQLGSNQDGSTQGYSLFEMSDSTVGVFYLAQKAGQWEEVIKIYDKSNLDLLQSFVTSSSNPMSFPRIRTFLDDNGDRCFYVNHYVNDTNYITIRTYQNGTLNPNYNSFSFAGFFASGFKYLNGELFFISLKQERSDTSNEWLDHCHIQVRDFSGNLKRDKLHINQHGSPLSVNINVDPKVHPLSGNLVFGDTRACNYTEVSPHTLDVVHSNIEFFTRSAIVPLYLPAFEVVPEGIECAGFGSYRRFENGNFKYDEQCFYATKDWGTDTAKPRMFGPINIANGAYAFAIERSSGTRFIAGSIPFDNSNISGQEFREALIYRFTQFGTDSLLLFGNKNHVPLELFPDPAGDLFMLSTYTDSWTTDSTFYVLTKLPSYSISNREEAQGFRKIQLYPNPARDYIQVEGLIGIAVDYSIFSQTGQLMARGSVKGDRIDIRQLEAGIYILKVVDEKGDPFQVIVKKT
ncbi:MAG TPA: hypothetical protein DCG19_04140 [Cryomorphaceae bacterium]|nr:hypothetical protein [Owenweeksia sp.]MBF99620.1 hypothetical protein [Owenweeksia sp.]HAD96571.1 hypothetical protein [Cryomorphaceae bacterium]|tara:strand:+ start:3749 stop:5233 length:1485 start_codon:yes stop_codon:yes gene_type:complete